MATYEIFENISKLSNEDKVKMCLELREYEDSVVEPNESPRRQLIFDEKSRPTSSNRGDNQFVLKFELLSTDEIHHIWEVSDRYVQQTQKKEKENADNEEKVNELM